MQIRNPADQTVYFGYGSNLWREQMERRCPNSTFTGIARLQGFRWIINERGYANVYEIDAQTPSDGVENNNSSTAASKGSDSSVEDEVWGLVYNLTPDDEARLDVNEGVPVAYTKELIEVEFWAEGALPSDESPPEWRDMLVYINRDMVAPSKPKEEYVYRMNMGVRDALKEGVPREYVQKVIRKFIPDVEDEGVRAFARKQALAFEDENL